MSNRTVTAAAEGLPASDFTSTAPTHDVDARFLAKLRRLNDDELAAISAFALALLTDPNADPVAAMTPHIGREKAEAVCKATLEADQ